MLDISPDGSGSIALTKLLQLTFVVFDPDEIPRYFFRQ